MTEKEKKTTLNPSVEDDKKSQMSAFDMLFLSDSEKNKLENRTEHYQMRRKARLAGLGCSIIPMRISKHPDYSGNPSRKTEDGKNDLYAQQSTEMFDRQSAVRRWGFYPSRGSTVVTVDFDQRGRVHKNLEKIKGVVRLKPEFDPADGSIVKGGKVAKSYHWVFNVTDADAGECLLFEKDFHRPEYIEVHAGGGNLLIMSGDYHISRDTKKGSNELVTRETARWLDHLGNGEFAEQKTGNDNNNNDSNDDFDPVTDITAERLRKILEENMTLNGDNNKLRNINEKETAAPTTTAPPQKPPRSRRNRKPSSLLTYGRFGEKLPRTRKKNPEHECPNCTVIGHSVDPCFVPEKGSRNEFYTSLAWGIIYLDGLPKDAALEAIEWLQSQSDERLPQGEIEALVDSAEGKRDAMIGQGGEGMDADSLEESVYNKVLGETHRVNLVNDEEGDRDQFNLWIYDDSRKIWVREKGLRFLDELNRLAESNPDLAPTADMALSMSKRASRDSGTRKIDIRSEEYVRESLYVWPDSNGRYFDLRTGRIHRTNPARTFYKRPMVNFEWADVDNVSISDVLKAPEHKGGIATIRELISRLCDGNERNIGILTDFPASIIIPYDDLGTSRQALYLTGESDVFKSTFIEVIRSLWPTHAKSEMTPKQQSRNFSSSLLGGKILNSVEELHPKDFEAYNSLFKDLITKKEGDGEVKGSGVCHFDRYPIHIFGSNTTQTFDANDDISSNLKRKTILRISTNARAKDDEEGAMLKRRYTDRGIRDTVGMWWFGIAYEIWSRKRGIRMQSKKETEYVINTYSLENFGEYFSQYYKSSKSAENNKIVQVTRMRAHYKATYPERDINAKTFDEMLKMAGIQQTHRLRVIEDKNKLPAGFFEVYDPEYNPHNNNEMRMSGIVKDKQNLVEDVCIPDDWNEKVLMKGDRDFESHADGKHQRKIDDTK